jgi:hypothetical protein
MLRSHQVLEHLTPLLRTLMSLHELERARLFLGNFVLKHLVVVKAIPCVVFLLPNVSTEIIVNNWCYS